MGRHGISGVPYVDRVSALVVEWRQTASERNQGQAQEGKAEQDREAYVTRAPKTQEVYQTSEEQMSGSVKGTSAKSPYPWNKLTKEQKVAKG